MSQRPVRKKNWSTLCREARFRDKKIFKKKLLELNSKCIWCERVLSKSNSTLEHLIPMRQSMKVFKLSDRWNFLALACEKCNYSRRGIKTPTRIFKKREKWYGFWT